MRPKTTALSALVIDHGGNYEEGVKAKKTVMMACLLVLMTHI